MKPITKLKRNFQDVDKWSNRCRKTLNNAFAYGIESPMGVFDLLIAVEVLNKALKEYFNETKDN